MQRIQRRLLVGVLAVAAAGGAAFAQAGGPAHQDAPTITVYRSPTCGCCKNWIEHLREHGFAVDDKVTEDMTEVKASLGVPAAAQSCHTAVVEGYVVEGHVPAADVERLLAEKPEVAGIAAPGMPIGSPGMEVPGREPDRYDVVAFKKDGTTRVFARH